MRNAFVGVCVTFLLSGCAASGPGAGPETEAAESLDRTTTSDGTPLLQVKLTDQTTDGRVMLMRGKLVNPHSEAVQGVRLMMLMGTPKGDGTFRITDVRRKELGSTIQPGKSTMFRWDIESQSNAGVGRFWFVAVPERLGDRDVPPPPEWTQDPKEFGEPATDKPG